MPADAGLEREWGDSSSEGDGGASRASSPTPATAAAATAGGVDGADAEGVPAASAAASAAATVAAADGSDSAETAPTVEAGAAAAAAAAQAALAAPSRASEPVARSFVQVGCWYYLLQQPLSWATAATAAATVATYGRVLLQITNNCSGVINRRSLVATATNQQLLEECMFNLNTKSLSQESILPLSWATAASAASAASAATTVATYGRVLLLLHAANSCINIIKRRCCWH
jgi:hypothetical protein